MRWHGKLRILTPVKLASLTGIFRRQLEAALPPRRHRGLNEARQQALVGPHLNIELRAQEKHDARKNHEPDRDPEPDDPPVLVLDVDDDGERHHERGPDGGVVPVEEGEEDPLVLGVVGVVVLVGPEGHRARPHAACAQRQEGEGGEEEGVLAGVRFYAVSGTWIARGRPGIVDYGR